jgi:hypothetical protein
MEKLFELLAIKYADLEQDSEYIKNMSENVSMRYTEMLECFPTSKELEALINIVEKGFTNFEMEQKQREARGYNEYMQGQAALQKEFANVRSADIPDVVNDYNTLKKIKQSMLFDEKIKSNPTLLAQKQQEANIADAQLRQKIAASQQLKETDKGIYINLENEKYKNDLSLYENFYDFMSRRGFKIWEI